MDWSLIKQGIEVSIERVTGEKFKIVKHSMVGGGSINAAYCIESNQKKYFVKLNDKNKLAMFEAEADGLNELCKANAIKVPSSLCTGVSDAQSFIVIDYLELSGQGSMQSFAVDLVKLHRNTQTQFGWFRENTIGSTLQKNTLTDNWLSFWHTQRLGFQLELAKQNGASKSLLEQGDKLLSRLDVFFKNYSPEASLLHGDLWSGNYAFTASGEPVIFDPATYYGDRECDIAMTELFGGFSDRFYKTYNELWPLDDGYSVRKTLYNLYHILNHFNMFGGGYESQANNMCGILLAEAL